MERISELKTLVLIIGPNGVGKSTTAMRLFKLLPNSCLLESEWCRSINPFDLTPEVELLTSANMSMLIRNYFQCSLVNYVVLSYGFHGPRKRIFDRVLNDLDDVEFRLLPITLVCSEKENIRRMLEDGREAARVKRAVEESRPAYANAQDHVIDTTDLTVDEVAEAVLATIRADEG